MFAYYGDRVDYAVIDESETDYKYLLLGYNKGIQRGDKIHIENFGGFLDIIIGDTDRGGATSDYSQESGLTAIDQQKIDDVTMYCDGYLEYYSNHDGEDTVDLIVDNGTGYGSNIYIALSDDNPTAYQSIKVTLIKSAYTAESRIRQTADEIELKVGNAGINLNKKQITLSAANTVVKGDLSVQKVMTYYPNGSIKSAYNGNGNGTIVYYYPIESTEVGYPFGQQMRVDDFVYDDNGNAVGMKTIYFKQDGGVAWVLSSSGLETTLSEYWSYMYDMVFDTDLVSLKAKIDQYKMNLAANLPNNISDFSQFHSTTQTDKDGRIVKGRMATSALPPRTDDGYYTGVFCLSQPLQVLVPQNGPSVPKNMYYPYWVVDKGVIIEQGNYYFAP